MSSTPGTSGPSFRQLPNGTRIFPKRGKPPQPGPGYEAERGDPFVHVPKLLPCVHRGRKDPKSDCCGQSPRIFCKVVGRTVVRSICVRCKANEEWVKDYYAS